MIWLWKLVEHAYKKLITRYASDTSLKSCHRSMWQSSFSSTYKPHTGSALRPLVLTWEFEVTQLTTVTLLCEWERAGTSFETFSESRWKPKFTWTNWVECPHFVCLLASVCGKHRVWMQNIFLAANFQILAVTHKYLIALILKPLLALFKPLQVNFSLIMKDGFSSLFNF